MRVCLILCPLALACSEPPPPVEVQQAPQTSPTQIVANNQGAQIEAGGARIEADEQGARIRAGNADIQADDNGVVIGAGNTEVRAGDDGVVIGTGSMAIRIDDNGVSIPGLGMIGAPQGNPNATPMNEPAGNSIVCRGSQNVVRSNVVLDGGRGPAIMASGSCTVVCNNCTLRSNATALMASGSSNVTLNGGSVQGRIAIMASGSSNVTTNGTQVRGAVNRSGNAQVQQN